MNTVFFIFHLGSGHLNIHKALAETEGGNGVGVALKVFFLEHAGTGEPREDAAGLESHVLIEIAAVDLVQTVDGDFGDVELAAFLHGDHEHRAPAVVAGIEAIAGLGQVVAVLAVEFIDLLEVVGNELFVEDVAGLGAHGGEHVFGVDFLVAFHNDVVDAGLFRHGKDQHGAFHKCLHVIEVAHFPDALDFLVDGVGAGGVALAQRQAHEDDVGVHDLEAAHLNVADGVAGGAHGHEGGRPARTGLLGGRRDRRGGSGGSGRCAERRGGLSGQFRGAGPQIQQRGTLEGGGSGLAAVDRHKAGIHGEAAAQLIEIAVNDQIRSGRFAQLAGLGQIDDAALGGKDGARPAQGHGLEAVRGQLINDLLRHVLRGVGHFGACIDLEGQHKHRIAGGERLSVREGQQAEQRQCPDKRPFTRKSFHIASPL